MTLISDLKKIASEITGNFISIGLSFPTVEAILDENTNIVNGYIFEFDGKKKSKSKMTYELSTRKLTKTEIKANKTSKMQSQPAGDCINITKLPTNGILAPFQTACIWS